MRSIEITKPGNVLDENGHVQFPGWSRKQVLTYGRDQIKADPLRIKEWDYYNILNEEYSVCLTIADTAYAGLISVSILDFKTGWQHTEGYRIDAPMGSMGMPSTTDEGDIHFEADGVWISFTKDGEHRHLTCWMENFKDGKPFECDIKLHQPEMVEWLFQHLGKRIN